MNWTCLAKSRDKWRAAVIAIMKLRPLGNAEILGLAEGLLASLIRGLSQSVSPFVSRPVSQSRQIGGVFKFLSVH